MLRRLGSLTAVTLVTGLALAGDLLPADIGLPETRLPGPTYVIPGPTEISTVYADGRETEVQTEEVWKLICGSDSFGVSSDDLRRWAENHEQQMAIGPVTQIGSPALRSGFTVVFNADATVPAEALTAFATAKAYLETLFSNPITVTVNVSFQNMGSGGVIGGTSSAFVYNVAYTTSRTGLVAGMDGDDVIQNWLPTGSTVPVKYAGAAGAVTNESAVEWTRANYNATVGTVGGISASMSFNTQFAPNFDYDPSNGVGGSQLSFIDVVVHETGHALGFVSGADNFSGINFTSLDLYRFQNSANNPATYADFQTLARLVTYNSPNDDVTTDLIAASYRMEDGSPYQASHFRQRPPYIGLMEPALSYGSTQYPNYFSTADRAAFDAIGYIYPACPLASISMNPTNQTACDGGAATFTVTATGATGYQWRRGSTLLTDGGNISGALTDTLVIDPVSPADAGYDYNVAVANDCGNAYSIFASLTVATGPAVGTQPATHTAHVGLPTTFTASATGTGTLSYQWRRNGSNLSDTGNIYGATTATLSIDPVAKVDAGTYDVVVTDACSSATSDPATLWLAGDLNCDGVISYGDINPFVLALNGISEYGAQYPGCNWYNADANNDGLVTYGDINPFVALLAGP